MISLVLRPFRRKSLSEIIAAELADAQFDLLRAQTAREYAHSVVEYNERQIERLRAALRDQQEGGK